jgi:hypothetical protein
LDLKYKFLQAIQENQEIIKKGLVEIVALNPQPVDTEELIRTLAEVPLKDQEITNLKEEKKALERDNKEYQEKNDKIG